MSWLRTSPLRQSLTRTNGGGSAGGLVVNNNGTSQNYLNTALRQRPIDTATDCDPRACYDSFCKHWQQAHDIIQRAQAGVPTHDDVLGVVSHLDFMVTLLLVELHHCNKIALPAPTDAAPPPAPCLEFLLSENLLDKLYEWGCSTGRYANAVRLEQLKLYELLVSHSRHQLLCHEPFLRPLLKILASSQGEIFPPDLEKRMVILLNQLCVVLMQNVHLLDLFFFSSQAHEHYKQDNNTQHPLRTGNSTGNGGSSNSNFIIFSLLIPYVHREGSLGHQARDALLLCMALSQKNSNIGTYIAQYSSMCPLLVTGLGGLYSRLPNSIEISSLEWHRITPDDVTEIPELTLFMNALEFCNAVVQVAHEMIKNQLLDFMYQGFIVPVLGPAILQTLKGKHFQTNVASQISAMSYLDLILRSITEPSLLRAFVRFLLDNEKFDGERILDTLVERLTSNDANLCMVTMALFDTLLSLNCEDLMLELLLKYLLPGKHVPISYRHKINKIDPYTNTTDFLLELTPEVMKRARDLTKHKFLGDTVSSQTSQFNPALPSPTSSMSKTIGANWNYYGLHSGESLYANYHAYLFEAHVRIVQCQKACTSWSYAYRFQKWPPKSMKPSQANAQAVEMIKQFFAEFSQSPVAEHLLDHASANGNDKKQLDSLQSIGESSGYESFKWRPADEDSSGMENADNSCALDDTANIGDCSFASSISGNGSGTTPALINKGKEKREHWRVSNSRNELNFNDLDFSEDLFAQGTVSLGPFINAIWRKLETFTSNTLYVNLHLTGLITRLACYPLPLIHSLLLRPDIVITSDTPSFHQVLRILKQQIDAELPVLEDSLEIIDVARSNLIDREFRLLNARKPNENSPVHHRNTISAAPLSQHPSNYAQLSAATPVQATASSSYDPFKRNDSKRKSISKSFTSMFSRSKASGATSPFSNSSSTAAQQPQQSQQSSQTSTGSNSSMNTRETSLSTMPTGVNGLNGSNPSSSNATDRNLKTNTSSFAGSSTNGGGNGSTTTLSTLTSMSSTLHGGNNSEPASLDSLSSMGAIASTSGTERTRDLALCAVLLDEWLKELAAIAQEQSVVLINELAY